MITKLFEIRDRLTFIPMLAVKLHYDNDAERFLLERGGGYIFTSYGDNNHILLLKMPGNRQATSVIHEWEIGRTIPIAVGYIKSYWGTLTSGDVVDVEFILKETTKPKQSERFNTGGGNED